MIQIWDERYGQEAYAYGEQPNVFFRSQIEKLQPGTLLLPAEGEGRNAVFAARMGWNVMAFDQSIEGKRKADLLASKFGVSIDYQVGEFSNLNFDENSFDVMGLIYAHFPAAVKSKYHQILSRYVKKGGVVIFEAFTKNHLSYVTQNPKVGGPKDVAMLFSTDEIKQDFAGFDILLLEETEIELQEGLFHNGLGAVVRFVGKKR